MIHVPKEPKALTKEEIRMCDIRRILAFTDDVEKELSFKNVYTLLPELVKYENNIFSEVILLIQDKISVAYSKSISGIDDIEPFRDFITKYQLDELPLVDDAESNDDLDYDKLNVSKGWLLDIKKDSEAYTMFMFKDVNGVFSKTLIKEDFSDITSRIKEIINLNKLLISN